MHFTGYVASKPFLEKVADIVQDIKKIKPSMTFGNLLDSLFDIVIYISIRDIPYSNFNYGLNCVFLCHLNY